MKTIAGAASFACLNRSRTREAPTPTIASTNSDADIEKNGASASPATARASSVLPVPGGPLSSTPCGMRAAEPCVLLGMAQEVDDLGQLRLRLVDPGDVGEGDGIAAPARSGAPASGRTRRASPCTLPARRISRTSSPTKRSVGPKPTSRLSHHGTLAGERLRVHDDLLLLEQVARATSCRRTPGSRSGSRSTAFEPS